MRQKESFDYAYYRSKLSDHEKKHAPHKLFFEGDTNLLLDGIRVSVVGTRNPTMDGIARAKILTEELVRHKIIVVSGLAKGIDTIAHETAIEHSGKTIAVLGTPLNEVYPRENRQLLERIKRDHLAISQFQEGYPFQKKNFPMRNRTMALISDATIIVEASEKSGTKHQGWEALRLGRFVYLMNNIVENRALSWPQEMIQYGAQVLKREDLSIILNEIPSFTSSLDVEILP